MKKKNISILVVDDEESMCTYLVTALALKGYKVTSVRSGQEVLEYIKRRLEYSVIILDIMMPEMDGLETLQKIKALGSTIPVIMLSALGQTSTIVKAIKLGASNYITKPFEDEELEIAIDHALEKKRLENELEDLKKQLKEEKRKAGDFISASEKMNEIKKTIETIADTDVTVLIQGESGVGKELIAQSIHSNSSRKGKTFIKVNCAAIPGELLESELFGYEKGAFTGANTPKPGRFGLAHQGTIFLDEIGDMSHALQAKLLQVLQDGAFTRLGAKEDTQVDLRVLAASNRNLEEAIGEKKFREDLYYRLCVVKIYVPPLRERKEDIPILCEHFLEMYKEKYNLKVKPLSKKLMRNFINYNWPGNVRELENVVKRLVILSDESSILEELSSDRIMEKAEDSSIDYHIPDHDQIVSLKKISKTVVMEVEKKMILKTLKQTRWNKKKAAEKLGISYKALLYKLKEIVRKVED
jgi:two-component system response regulator AtoC